MANLKDTEINDVNFFKVPIGNSNQRPNSPEVGMLRYNSETNSFEYYDGNTWISLRLFDI